MFDKTSQAEPVLLYLARKGKKATPKGKISLVGANVSADSADHRNLVLIIHTSDEEKNRIRVAPVPRQKSRGVERDRWINCIREIACSADVPSTTADKVEASSPVLAHAPRPPRHPSPTLSAYSL